MKSIAKYYNEFKIGPNAYTKIPEEDLPSNHQYVFGIIEDWSAGYLGVLTLNGTNRTFYINANPNVTINALKLLFFYYE